MLYKFGIFSALLLSFHLVTGQQQQEIPNADTSVYNFFDNDDILNCSLTFDIKKFRKDKNKDKYQEALFEYYSPDGDTVESVTKLKARGVSRRELCYFPPIKLKFKKSDNLFPYFENIKSLKLVTHCKSSDDFEQYLFKEFVVYKLFNVLTDKSFRVKLIHITYFDQIGKIDPINKYGFFIEEPKKVADRNNSFFVKNENLGMRYIEPQCMMTLTMFQAMIGNPDWSITGLHNIKLLKSKNIDELLPYAVPYDFDNTGLVNPDHATPPENSGISSVKERKFDGICGSEEEYLAIISEFNNQKQTFLTIIDEFDLLDDKSKEEMKEYLDSFYILVNSQDFYNDRILPICKE